MHASYFYNFYKKQQKPERFINEKKHLIDTYGLEESIVEEVINDIKDGKNTSSKYYIDEDINNCPIYKLEKEIITLFEEFKSELVYDGFLDFANIVRLHHFYKLFTPSYLPSF
jgi:hypothetical protein